MRFFYSILYIVIPMLCWSQSDYIFIGELRFGSGDDKAVHFDNSDDIKYRHMNSTKNADSAIVKASLNKKEWYYDKEDIGTEVRFRINRKALDSRKTINVLGELYTELDHQGKKEDIKCEFRNTLELSHNPNDFEQIGPYTFKLRNPIEVWDPAKFSITSKTRHMNKLLYFEDATDPFYSNDVKKIMSWEKGKNKQLDLEFMANCYDILEMVEPYFNNDSFISIEKAELDQHMRQLEQEISASKINGLNGTRTLEELERDLFESQIVEEKFNQLFDSLNRLHPKLKELLEQNTYEPESNCNKNVEFNIALAYIFGGNTNRLEVIEEMVDSTRLSENSSSLIVMSNWYPFKRSAVDVGLGLGISLNLFAEKIQPMPYVGMVLAMGKKRNLALNIGFTYVPVERLNDPYNLMNPIFLSEVRTEEMVIGVEHKWSPTLSLKIPLSSIVQILSGSTSSNEVSVNID